MGMRGKTRSSQAFVRGKQIQVDRRWGSARVRTLSIKGELMKPIHIAGATALAAVSWCALSGTATATTAINGQLNAVANATLNSVTATNNSNQSWSGVPATLATSAFAIETSGSALVTASGGAVANWASADAGTVNFSNYGWTIADFGQSSISAAANLTSGRGGDGDDWSYTFTATSNGEIVLNYKSSLASGNPFGLWGWGVDFTGTGTGYPSLNGSDPTQNGTFIGYLYAGQTYTIGLSGNPNITGGSWSGLSYSYMNGSFNWHIIETPIPEPSTWAMLGLGFVGVSFAGFARRRKDARYAF